MTFPSQTSLYGGVAVGATFPVPNGDLWNSVMELSLAFAFISGFSSINRFKVDLAGVRCRDPSSRSALGTFPHHPQLSAGRKANHCGHRPIPRAISVHSPRHNWPARGGSPPTDPTDCA